MSTRDSSSTWRVRSDQIMSDALLRGVSRELLQRTQEPYKPFIGLLDADAFANRPTVGIQKALDTLNKIAAHRKAASQEQGRNQDQDQDNQARAHIKLLREYEAALVGDISERLHMTYVARLCAEEPTAQNGTDSQVTKILNMAQGAVELIVCDTGKHGDFRVTRNNSGFADYGHSTSGLANGGIPTVNIGDNALEPSHRARKSAGGHRSRHKRAELSGPGRWFRGAVLVAAAFFVASIPGNSQEAPASAQTGMALKPTLK